MNIYSEPIFLRYLLFLFLYVGRYSGILIPQIFCRELQFRMTLYQYPGISITKPFHLSVKMPAPVSQVGILYANTHTYRLGIHTSI